MIHTHFKGYKDINSKRYESLNDTKVLYLNDIKGIIKALSVTYSVFIIIWWLVKS